MSVDIHLIGKDYTADELKYVALDPETNAVLVKEITPPLTDHGELSGLADDDHPHYYNLARHTKAVHDALGLDHGSLSGLNDDDHTQYLQKSGGTMTGLLTLSGAPTANLHASTKKYVDDHAAAALSQLTIDVNKNWNAKNITNMGTIEHRGATLKSGIQTEGRCSMSERDASGAYPENDSFSAFAPFREKMTNTPSSITLSNAPETDERYIKSTGVQFISLFGFNFVIVTTGAGDAVWSLSKKYITVGN